MSGTKVFTNEKFGTIRAVECDGRPWLAAKDVCMALELGRQQEYSSLFRSTERRHCMVDTIRNKTEMVVISPHAFEKLFSVSNSRDKQDVRDFVFHKVLPSMGYEGLTAEVDMDEMLETPRQTRAVRPVIGGDEELLAQALVIAKEIIDRKGGESLGADCRIVDISKRLADVGEQLGNIARDLMGAGQAEKAAQNR